MISSVNEYGVRGSRRDCLTSVHKVKGFGADFECLLRSPNVLGLHGGIDRDPRQILRPQRPALVRHPQALGQEKFQLAAETLAPMAQVRALVRKLVLEELLSGEVLEVWIIDPAFAHAFVGQSVNMLEQKSPITNCVAIPGRPPSLYSGAISPSMNSQSILFASCTSSCLMLMIWSSRARNRSADPVVSCFFGRIAPSDAATESCFSIRGNRENEIASFRASDTETLQSQVNKAGKKRLSLSGLQVFHGRLISPALVMMIAPHRGNRSKPPTQDRRRLSRYMRRWLVERFFAWIQWQRRILIRWEYHAHNFLGFVQLACLVILFKQF